MSWFTENVQRLKNTLAVADDNKEKKAAYVYALESASLTQKLVLPQIREEYQKLLNASTITVPINGQEEPATAEHKEQILGYFDRGVEALESFSAYAIAMEIQEDGKDVYSPNELNETKKAWKDHTVSFITDIEELIALIENAFPIVTDPSTELPADAAPEIKKTLADDIEVAKITARETVLASYYDQHASEAAKAQLSSQLANIQDSNKPKFIKQNYENYYQTISEAHRLEVNQLIKAESDRLIQLSKKDAINTYLIHGTQGQKEAYKAKYQQYVTLAPYRKNLLERAESGKVSAHLLCLLKEFQLLAFKGEVEPAKTKLTEINEYITNNRQKLFCNHYTTTVFAKLLQVKARVNAQFGESKYDDPTQPNRLSAIANNFEANFVHNNDPELINRINNVKRFVINDLKKVDIDEYTPWFLPRFFRWVRSIFSTKSDYENNTPNKQAWSMISADFNYQILPTYVETGITPEQQLRMANSNIRKKLNPVPAPENQQQNEVVKDIFSHFSRFKTSVEQLVGVNARGEEKFSASTITAAQAAHLAKVVGDERLLTSFVGKPSIMRRYDDLHLTTEETNLIQNVLKAYPKWPDAPLSFEILNNPVESKKYAEQLGVSIRQALLHGDETTHSKLLKQFCRFLIPALFQVGDLINLKSDYSRGMENFAGLKFYKEIFNQVFKEPLPQSKGNAAEIAIWNQIKDLKTVIFDKYDGENNTFNLSDNPQERLTQKTDIAQKAKNLSKAIWSHQPFNLPKYVYVGNNPIEPERFYIKLAEFRSRLKEIICETRVGNTPEFDAKNKEDIQLLQHFKCENNQFVDDNIDKILNGKLFNNDGKERVVQPLVRLLAALNALANKFLQYPSYGYTYADFFNHANLSYRPEIGEILKFISTNNAVQFCDLPQNKKSPIIDIHDLLMIHIGKQVAPVVSSPAVKSPVSVAAHGGSQSPGPIPPSPASVQQRKESGSGIGNGRNSPQASTANLNASKGPG